MLLVLPQQTNGVVVSINTVEGTKHCHYKKSRDCLLLRENGIRMSIVKDGAT